jgi:hypothetical protein
MQQRNTRKDQWHSVWHHLRRSLCPKHAYMTNNCQHILPSYRKAALEAKQPSCRMGLFLYHIQKVFHSRNCRLARNKKMREKMTNDEKGPDPTTRLISFSSFAAPYWSKT